MNSPTWAVTTLSPLVALAKSREGWESLTVFSEGMFELRRGSDAIFSLGTAKTTMIIIMRRRIMAITSIYTGPYIELEKCFNLCLILTNNPMRKVVLLLSFYIWRNQGSNKSFQFLLSLP